MIKSLRSLCLLKVSQDGMSYDVLPADIAKDLMLMKIFNGNFIHESYSYDSGYERADLSAMTILYDGVTWSFATRGDFVDIICCVWCSGTSQPELFQLMVAEGETVTASSPFSQVRHWFGRDYSGDDYRKHCEQQINTKISVIVQDETSGRIEFLGAGGYLVFKMFVVVELTPGGTRRMIQSGQAIEGLEMSELDNKELLESEGCLVLTVFVH